MDNNQNNNKDDDNGMWNKREGGIEKVKKN